MFHEALSNPLAKCFRLIAQLFTGNLHDDMQRACYACVKNDFILSNQIDARFDFSLYMSIVLGKRVAELVTQPFAIFTHQQRQHATRIMPRSKFRPQHGLRFGSHLCRSGFSIRARQAT